MKGYVVLEKLNEQILRQSQELAGQISSWRRELHRHPGLGFEIDENRKYVYDELKKIGLEPEKCGKAGWTAVIGKPEGKTILLRADMDALPLDEKSGEEFSSVNPGKMHACGHDMHTAMLLGAAKLLKENESLLEGRVKLMFQPAEEIGEGACDMVESGVLDDPAVDCAEMIHVAAGAPFPTGMIMIPQGGSGASACCEFSVKVTGKGGHGATPAVCIDPISGLCHIFCSLEEIFSRELGLTEFLSITVGKISGGSAPNVIPDTAEMNGSIRAMTREKMEWAQTRIREIAEGVASVYRCKAEVEYTGFLPPLIADPHMADSAEKYLTELLGQGAMRIPAGMAGGGSEDFAWVAEKVPSVPLFLGAGNASEGYTVPAHNAEVRFDERALSVGTAAHTYFAIRYLQENK